MTTNKMTIKEAFEHANINIISESKFGDWWEAEHNGYVYVIKEVDGRSDWTIRFHIDQYAKLSNGKYSHIQKLCTRSNFSKAVALIKNTK